MNSLLSPRSGAEAAYVRVLKLVDEVVPTSVDSKNFRPIELRPDKPRFSPNAYYSPLAGIARALLHFEYSGPDGNDVTVHPFSVVGNQLAKLLDSMPRSYSEFNAASKWLEQVKLLVDAVEADIKGKEWGRRTSFSRLSTLIADYRAAIALAGTSWSEDDEIDATTAIQIVIGSALDVDRYAVSIGTQVGILRGRTERGDLSPTDRPDPMSELLNRFAGEIGMSFSTPTIAALGNVQNLPVLDLRKTQSKKGDEPNFGALIVALATIASAANNIPGGLLADAADSLDEVLHSLQSQSPVTVLREQRTKGLLKQLVEDIKAELAEPDVKTPSATKAVVAEAVKVAETELPKLDHMVEREDVVLRILTVSVIGTLNQRTSAIESVSKLAELYALPAPKEARVIGHGETTDRSRHAVQQATT